MVAQQVNKMLVSAAFLLIMLVAVIRYDSVRVTVQFETHCGNYVGTVCVQCLHVPSRIHQAATYTPFAGEKQRLAVLSCLNYTCAEMIQLLVEDSFELDKSDIPLMYLTAL